VPFNLNENPFFQALVLTILFYASETWTLRVRVTVMTTLEAFYLKCLMQIIGVPWHQHITTSEIGLLYTMPVLAHIAEQIARRHKAAFGHIARLVDNFQARLALRCQIDASLGCLPSKIGNVVLVAQDLVGQDSNCFFADLWRRAVLRGHGDRMTPRPSPAMQI